MQLPTYISICRTLRTKNRSREEGTSSRHLTFCLKQTNLRWRLRWRWWWLWRWRWRWHPAAMSATFIKSTKGSSLCCCSVARCLPGKLKIQQKTQDTGAETTTTSVRCQRLFAAAGRLVSVSTCLDFTWNGKKCSQSEDSKGVAHWKQKKVN